MANGIIGPNELGLSLELNCLLGLFNADLCSKFTAKPLENVLALALAPGL